MTAQEWHEYHPEIPGNSAIETAQCTAWWSQSARVCQSESVHQCSKSLRSQYFFQYKCTWQVMYDPLGLERCQFPAGMHLNMAAQHSGVLHLEGVEASDM